MPSVQALQVVADLLASGGPGADLPKRLCGACLRLLKAEGAGLSLSSSEGRSEPEAAANPLSAELEQLQFSLGEGPCVEAVASGRPVLVPDLVATGQARWPLYSPAALDLGISAVFSFPLQIGSIRLGALDVYRSTSGDFDRETFGTALACADAATTIFLHLADQMPLDGELDPRLWVGSGSQRVVHQATGMVAVQASVSMADALLLLQARAFAEGRAVQVVAESVVARAVRFALDAPEPGDGDPRTRTQQ